MKKEMITSLDNKRIKDFTKLNKRKYREETRMFIAEGHHLVEEAKKHGNIVEIFTTSEAFEGTLIAPFIMKKLAQAETPQPILAICKMPKKNVELGARVVALDNVQDPGNVGAVIRTARAMGFTGVLVKGCDAYNPKSVRASQGAIFNIPVMQVPHLSDHFDNREIVGALLDEHATTYDEYEPDGPFMLILGSEGSGITKDNLEYLDRKVYIPIDFESLNVAAAGAILMNQYKKK